MRNDELKNHNGIIYLNNFDTLLIGKYFMATMFFKQTKKQRNGGKTRSASRITPRVNKNGKQIR